MPGINEDRDRQVVPIWRSFETTIRRGELAPLSAASGDRFTDEMVAELLEDWKESPSLSVASDLVSAAFTLGRFTIANDAAEFILSTSSSPPGASGVAALYLGKGILPAVTTGSSPLKSIPSQEEGLGIAFLPEHLHAGIREIRKQLIEHQRNPILWIDLARLYTSLGLQEKARRAMRAALTLAPENRFVLRAASRFLLHLGRKDHAHWLLANAASSKSDPWILAAEIAVSAANHKTSKFIKTGRRMLELQNHAPFHLSELASALGTLESLAGNLKSAKKLINLSLQQPAENSIAQAAWLSRRLNVTLVAGTSPTQSFEANAWLASKAAKWNWALVEAERWQSDQPFSSRPAMFGSHLASSVVEDYDLAVAFAKQGLLSNPEEFPLHNNLAFSLAMRGDLAEAQDVLQQINTKRLTDPERIVFEATSGLIAFRSGDAAAGRILYQSAITRGKRIQDKKQSIARIYYAIEELRIHSPDAEGIRKQALTESAVLVEPWEVALVERLNRYKPR